MISNKVIFLDVDGVLCIDSKLSDSCIKNLKRIVENTGAKIVLSSNWRLYEKYYQKLVNVFKKYNLKIYSKTIDFKDMRCLEIWIWCKKNRPDMCVIVDDRQLSYEFFGPYIKNCFIKTDPKIGIAEAQVSVIISMLNKNILIKNNSIPQTKKKSISNGLR